MFNIFKKSEEDSVSAMATGELLRIDKCCDPVFSEKMMGDGFIIKPQENDIVSPIDGSVVMLFPTMHAIGLEDKDGKEYLIHIGVETVNLNGEGFESFVNVGDLVVKGQKLIEADFDSFKDKVTSTDVILLATDSRTCTIKEEKFVKKGEEKVAIFK